MNHLPTYMMKALIEREQNGILRKLRNSFPPIDFCSNDYLGFSKLGLLSRKVQEANSEAAHSFGATGSRLISGNSVFVEEAEKQIALFHHAKGALIFNSGYDANLGLLSSVPQKTDLILYDERVHASIQDGIRLSDANAYKFTHNSTSDLEALITKHQRSYENIYVVVESVYALDGDLAPLIELADICKPAKNIFLIVDEAHAIGVFGNQGRGLCNALNIEQKCFARVYTFGKAMGCQGAVVVGSEVLRSYLINFARSFIYTTALPQHCIDAILHAYQLLIETDQKTRLQENISYFYSKTSHLRSFIPSQSGIHSLIAGNADQLNRLERALISKNIHIRPMRTPTVKPGHERLRFSIHSYNTREEMDEVFRVLGEVGVR